ncbi:PR domain zinc finger protein 5-like [Uranotaenia lowii]|uniref:PR domain zinc finger protein 5-like n=1 Tax=Uranotaenia lowii TaxID=190385 RepID=UPI002478AAC3|nr:PR domain zinc finger protein 5-like [Uranotaenia lowii]XP_055588152.1 PR domain zinc finger protein 5-like [Uranotaenia lowii]
MATDIKTNDSIDVKEEDLWKASFDVSEKSSLDETEFQCSSNPATNETGSTHLKCENQAQARMLFVNQTCSSPTIKSETEDFIVIEDKSCDMPDGSFTEIHALEIHDSIVIKEEDAWKDNLYDGDGVSDMEVDSKIKEQSNSKTTIVSDHQRKHSCHLCNETFNVKDRHFVTVHPNHPRFQCKFCQEEFLLLSIFRNHEETCPADPSVDKFSCKGCGIIVSSLAILSQHMQNEHSVKKDFACEHCDCKYEQKPSLILHQMAAHADKRQFECKSCGERFSLERKFELHRRRCVARSENLSEKDPDPALTNINGNNNSTVSDTGRMLKSFKCSKCVAIYTRENGLQDHFAAVHLKRPRYGCEFCGKQFFGVQGYRKHRQRDHSDVYKALLKKRQVGRLPLNMLFKMKGCTVVEENSEEQDGPPQTEKKGHYVAPGRKSYDYTKCSAKFSKKIPLENHFGIDHIKKPRFECEICGARMYNQKSYITHRQGKHPAEYNALEMKHRPNPVPTNYLYLLDGCQVVSMLETFKCDTCGTQFSSAKLLNLHVKTYHSAKKVFSCDKCDQKYLTKESLERHVILEHIKKPRFECEYCGQQFFTKWIYCNHRKRTHAEHYREWAKQHKYFQNPPNTLYDLPGVSKTLPCLFCDSKFENKHQLGFHVRMLHPETKTDRQLVCEACNQTFPSKWCLETHYASQHVGKPQYECEFCGKPFFTASSYKAHRQLKHPVEYAESLKKHDRQKHVPSKRLFMMNGCNVVENVDESEIKVKYESMESV